MHFPTLSIALALALCGPRLQQISCIDLLPGDWKPGYDTTRKSAKPSMSSQSISACTFADPPVIPGEPVVTGTPVLLTR